MANPEQTNSLSNQARPGEERTQRLSDRVEKATEQVAESALAEVQHARERAESGLERGRDELGERIRRVSSALRTAGDDLREQDESVARYAAMASDRVDRVASYVTSADLRTVARDVERFAREQPVPFFGGAFLLGLAVGRFLKSSASTDAQAMGGSIDSNAFGSGRERDATNAQRAPMQSRQPMQVIPSMTSVPSQSIPSTPSMGSFSSMAPPSTAPYGIGQQTPQSVSIPAGGPGARNEPSSPGAAGTNQGPRRTPGNP